MTQSLSAPAVFRHGRPRTEPPMLAEEVSEGIRSRSRQRRRRRRTCSRAAAMLAGCVGRVLVLRTGLLRVLDCPHVGHSRAGAKMSPCRLADRQAGRCRNRASVEPQPPPKAPLREPFRPPATLKTPVSRPGAGDKSAPEHPGCDRARALDGKGPDSPGARPTGSGQRGPEFFRQATTGLFGHEMLPE